MAVHGINHIAFRTPDPARLRAFHLELSSGRPAEAPDEIAFDVDAAGFDAALGRARRLDAVQRDPVAPNLW